MKVLNQLQLVVILVFLAVGSLIFVSSYFIKKPGVVVVSVTNPNCQSIHPGDIITEAGGNQIQTLQDFNSIKFQSNQFVSLVINSGPGGCIAMSDGSLGISVNDITSSGMIFGVDLVGGKVYSLSTIPSDQIQNISRILNSRVIYFGLAGLSIQNANGIIEITAPPNMDINQILFHGKMEGSVEEQLNYANNVATVFIGDNNYTITQLGDSVSINNQTYSVNDSFYLKNVKTTIANTTNTSVTLSLQIYNNSDVLGEVPGYSQVGVDQNSGLNTFTTVLSLSPSAASKFNEISKNIKTAVVGGQLNLAALLVNKLDGIEDSRLGIPVSLKGQNLNNVEIIISDQNKGSLLNKKMIAEAAINSGYVPFDLSVANTKNVAPSQENNVIPSVAIIIFALVAAPLVLGTKYKKLKHNSLSILIGAAEIFSIISLFAAFQIFYKINSVFDFAALIGIVLISINWMINVISLNLSRHAQKEMMMKIRYKKIISMTGMAKILLVVVAIGFAVSGYQSTGIIIISGIILDWLLFRSFYKSFIS